MNVWKKSWYWWQWRKSVVRTRKNTCLAWAKPREIRLFAQPLNGSSKFSHQIHFQTEILLCPQILLEINLTKTEEKRYLNRDEKMLPEIKNGIKKVLLLVTQEKSSWQKDRRKKTTNQSSVISFWTRTEKHDWTDKNLTQMRLVEVALIWIRILATTMPTRDLQLRCFRLHTMNNWIQGASDALSGVSRHSEVSISEP